MVIMHPPAYNTPRIKSVDMENVRGFKKLKLKFSPGINIVSTVERGSGKSNLLALLSGAIEDAFMLYGDNIRRGAKKGHLRVEYEPFNFTFHIDKTPLCYGILMMSDFRQFKTFLQEIPREHCFLVELDSLISYTTNTLAVQEVLNALAKARCQVIATVMEFKLKGKKLPNGARQIKI
jgi:hypothetical protein